MAETNFRIDIRWLTPKTCLRPHSRNVTLKRSSLFIIFAIYGKNGVKTVLQ